MPARGFWDRPDILEEKALLIHLNEQRRKRGGEKGHVFLPTQKRRL